MPSQSPSSPDDGGPCFPNHDSGGSKLESEPANRIKRRHKKSRLGCGNCKKRKIKCDESRPECTRCLTFGVVCDYIPNNERPSMPKPSVNTTESQTRRKRGRPRTQWPVVTHDAEASDISPTTITPESMIFDDILPDVHLDDFTCTSPELEASLHYVSYTADIIGSAASTWQQCTVDLTQRYPFLYSAIISISAFHLARSACPTKAASYINLANLHLSTTLGDATDFLPQLYADGYQPIYLTSIIACFASLANGPSRGDLLIVTPDGRAPWLGLLRAVRSVLQPPAVWEPSSVEYVGIGGKGITEPLLPAVTINTTAAELRDWDWESSFPKMTDRSRVDTAAMAMYQGELEMTRACHHFARRRASGGKDNGSRFMIIIGWVYRLGDAFISGLETGDKNALLILGHFALVLGLLEEEYWWLEGWSVHLLRQINDLMGQIEVLPQCLR